MNRYIRIFLYEYFASKNGWNPDTGESAVDYSKAIVIARIKEMISAPIQKDTLDAYYRQGEAAAKQAAAEIEAQIKLVE